MLLKFLDQFLGRHAVLFGHRSDAPGKFLAADTDPLLGNDLTEDEVELHLVAGALLGGSKKLLLMATDLLLTDAALLVLADDLLEDRGALLLDHAGGGLHGDLGQELLDHFASDGTEEVLLGIGH